MGKEERGNCVLARKVDPSTAFGKRHDKASRRPNDYVIVGGFPTGRGAEEEGRGSKSLDFSGTESLVHTARHSGTAKLKKVPRPLKGGQKVLWILWMRTPPKWERSLVTNFGSKDLRALSGVDSRGGERGLHSNRWGTGQSVETPPAAGALSSDRTTNDLGSGERKGSN